MDNLTIFSTPKPFSDPHIATIQRNAITSWKALGESVEVWLAGNEQGVEQIAGELEVNYIADIDRNNSGTPRIDSIFSMVKTRSSAKFFCYVNADILLFPDLLDTLKLVVQFHSGFLLVGQRWDKNIRQPLEMFPGWHLDFLSNLQEEGKLHAPMGSDYFVFPRHLFNDIPPFAVGRAGWDNWMIYHGRRHHMPVIDATGSITAVHQNHDFKHLPGGMVHRNQPESLGNLTLAGGRPMMFTLVNTNKKIINGRIVNPPLTRDYLSREISITPLLHIQPIWLGKAIYIIFNPRRVKKDNEKDRKMQDNIAKISRESK